MNASVALHVMSTLAVSTQTAASAANARSASAATDKHAVVSAYMLSSLGRVNLRN